MDSIINKGALQHNLATTSDLDRRLKAFVAFDAANDHYRALRLRASRVCDEMNTKDVSSPEWKKLWNELMDPEHVSGDRDVPRIKGNIHVDYGLKLKIHPTCFINRGCIIVDNPIHAIEIGEHTLLAPNVTVASISHPIDWRNRNGQRGPSLAAGVEIGKHCFLGANSVILPGVIIGDGCVIGASSVVTRSMPAYHVVVGHPARPTRKVAYDVPDAPGLRYEADGVTVVPEQHRVDQDQRQTLGRLKLMLGGLAVVCAILAWHVFESSGSPKN